MVEHQIMYIGHQTYLKTLTASFQPNKTGHDCTTQKHPGMPVARSN